MLARPVHPSLVILLFGALVATDAPAAEKKGLGLLEHCPKDPLLVLITEVGEPAKTFDGVLDLVQRFGGETAELEAKVAQVEQELGCSIRDDLLGSIGPEVGVIVDLPPIDTLAIAMADPAKGIPHVLGGIGVLGQVRRVEPFDACLRKLLTKDGAAVVAEEGGLVKVTMEEGASGPPVSLYYGFAGGSFALGASPEFVRASLDARPDGQRLKDGADFVRVVANLDADPARLFYLNLPKLRELLASSALVKQGIASEPEAAALFEHLVSPEFLPMGIGSTSVDVNGGTRTTNFGPSTLSGGSALAGVVAAIAVPNFINAVDRGKQKRTMADIRSTATAVEEYAIDNNVYPGPTGGWVNVDWLAESVSPTYIRELPTVDGWGHPIRFWSDGKRYILVSPGKDGEQQADWAASPGPGGATSSFADDIVFEDGSFLQWPEGKQQ